MPRGVRYAIRFSGRSDASMWLQAIGSDFDTWTASFSGALLFPTKASAKDAMRVHGITGEIVDVYD